MDSKSLCELTQYFQQPEKFQDELRQLPTKNTAQHEGKRPLHRNVRFWIVICILFILLGGIMVLVIATSSGDGTIDHFRDAIPEGSPALSSIDDSSGIPPPSVSPGNPNDQSNWPTNLPSETPLYHSPSAEECEAVSNGEIMLAHEDKQLLHSFKVSMELALAENVDPETVVEELEDKMEAILMPIIVGCSTTTIRRNMLSFEEKMKHRQLILSKYSIAGAQVGVEMGHTVCMTSGYSNCIAVIANIDLYLKGLENLDDLWNMVSSVFAPEEGIIEILEMSHSLVGLMVQSVQSKAEASPLTSSLPTLLPSAKPTGSPTVVASTNPTTTAPSIWPTTYEPSKLPTSAPSMDPTKGPSSTPSAIPTVADSSNPTSGPSPRPTTEEPTRAPTPAPTKAPSAAPSKVPSAAPSRAPSRVPTKVPSMVPTYAPSSVPTSKPSVSPSSIPTITPSSNPSFAPVTWPTTEEPTRAPSSAPSKVPTVSPSSKPTDMPTVTPSLPPTPGPSGSPSSGPTITPSVPPTPIPSLPPSSAPTFLPSLPPSVAPTPTPTTSPPTMAPSIRPTRSPSAHPTPIPTTSPSMAPTESPSTSSSPTLTPPLRVACVGDSLTRGRSGGNRGYHTYPFQLQQMLGVYFEVRNFGRNAMTAVRGLSVSYVAKWQFQASLDMKPDIYLLMLGTNDARYWVEHGHKFRGDMEWIVNKVRSISAESPPRIIVAIPPWVKTDVYGIRNDVLVNSVQPAIRALATVKNVQLVNMYDVTYNRGDSFTYDGLHLNQNGYRSVAEVWKAAIECNPNGTCEVGENSETCPADCN